MIRTRGSRPLPVEGLGQNASDATARCPRCDEKVVVDTDGNGRVVDYEPGPRRVVHVCERRNE